LDKEHLYVSYSGDHLEGEAMVVKLGNGGEDSDSAAALSSGRGKPDDELRKDDTDAEESRGEWWPSKTTLSRRIRRGAQRSTKEIESRGSV
jgi:hypothetical protein